MLKLTFSVKLTLCVKKSFSVLRTLILLVYSGHLFF